MNFPPPARADNCYLYWDEADWLPPWYILDQWCQQDDRCRQAKQQALLSACERGEVAYRRSDRKTFDDPVHELAARGILIVGRTSFEAWATRLEGKSPLTAPARPAALPPRPAWADASWSPAPAGSAPKAAPPAPTTIHSESAPIAKESDLDDEGQQATAPDHAIASVPSADIVEAFRIKDDDRENAAWWDQRMRDAKRYGLLDARTAKGRLQVPSYWRPDLVAIWLIDKGHLSTKTAKHIVLRHFPDSADALDYATE